MSLRQLFERWAALSIEELAAYDAPGGSILWPREGRCEGAGGDFKARADREERQLLERSVAHRKEELEDNEVGSILRPPDGQI